MNDIERAMTILRDGDWWNYLHFETPDGEGAYDEFNRSLDIALAALQAQLDRERELNGWIKLSEGLPEEYTPVLIAIDGKRVGKGEIRHSHNGRYWYDFEMRGSIDFYSVTHWMPLLLPPREERV